jgi:thiamine kinase-like enzyme
MQTVLENILAQIPDWENKHDLVIEPLEGLTNKNYLVTTASGKFVLRVVRENGSLLGIDRQVELTALASAASIGVGPEVIHSILPEGHLVTRFLPGRHLPVEEYRQPETLQRVITTVKQVHGLPAIPGAFSPFRRIESYASQAKTAGIPFPVNFEACIERMRAIEAHQQMDDSNWLGLCHNDLYSGNIIDDGSIRLIDWEFSGMGDVYFDLAQLVYSYDDIGPIPAELEHFLLECYFGKVTETHRTRLQDMKFMVNFFSAMWGMLNHAMVLQGAIPAVNGFDYLKFSQYIFLHTLKDFPLNL